MLLFPGANRGCDDVIPHRPWTCDYGPKWDYHITRYAGELGGYRAFREYRSQSCEPLSCHFQCGFVTAYEDIALNKRPAPPVVPPPKYWNAYYRSCAGKPCVDDWFAGYDAGREIGLQSGVSRFQEVYLRRGGCPGGAISPVNYQQSSQGDFAVPQLGPTGASMTPSPMAPPMPSSIVPPAAGPRSATEPPTTVMPRALPNTYGPHGSE